MRRLLRLCDTATRATLRACWDETAACRSGSALTGRVYALPQRRALAVDVEEARSRAQQASAAKRAGGGADAQPSASGAVDVFDRALKRQQVRGDAARSYALQSSPGFSAPCN
jgi:hypothetical protein